MDVANSGVDSAINDNNLQPFGLVEYASHIHELSAWDHFDMIIGLIIYGATVKYVKVKTELKPKPPVTENWGVLYDRVKESEIEVSPQHGHPPTSVALVGDQPMTNTQLERRSMLELTSLTPDKVRNNIPFSYSPDSYVKPHFIITTDLVIFYSEILWWKRSVGYNYWSTRTTWYISISMRLIVNLVIWRMLENC